MLLFQEFDVDNSGIITKDNLKEVFRIKSDLSDEEIDEIIKMHDKEKDGQISFNEFKEMLLGDNKEDENSSASDTND